MSIEEIRAQINSGIADLEMAPTAEMEQRWSEVGISELSGIYADFAGALVAARDLHLAEAVVPTMQTEDLAKGARDTFGRAAEGAVRTDPGEMLRHADQAVGSAGNTIATGKQIYEALGGIMEKMASIGEDLNNLDALCSTAESNARNTGQEVRQAKQAAEQFRDSL